MATFALIGAAGYIAPKHLQAIQNVGGQLVAALDPHDSVGVLDTYFPRCLYFREPERFDRWLSRHPVDYVSVCSPNYLHDAHCLMGLRSGADVICEKPLVLNERNLDNLAYWEQKTGKRVNVILQCRLHPASIRAKRLINPALTSNISIDYSTPRGLWYSQSWKGDVEKSGGLVTNIGIHLFDLAGWLMGFPDYHDLIAKDYSVGHFYFGATSVIWQLSTSMSKGSSRMFDVFGDTHCSLDLTTGFAELHSGSYYKIVNGMGYGIEDIRFATRITEAIRNGH
jgi:UDP-N-acetyl-2-amino-2-deoxyglucuronate dehydrogenase